MRDCYCDDKRHVMTHAHPYMASRQLKREESRSLEHVRGLGQYSVVLTTSAKTHSGKLIFVFPVGLGLSIMLVMTLHYG